MNVKILVAHHKPSIIIEDDIFLPIHVGKSKSVDDLSIIGDDSGENISSYNHLYCELTAVYWAWKNLKDLDYVGLCHYRRYFLSQHLSLFHTAKLYAKKRIYNYFGNFIRPNQSIPIFDQVFTKSSDELRRNCEIFSYKINNGELFPKYDIVTTKSVYFTNSNNSLWFKAMGIGNMDLLKSIIYNDFQDYVPYYEECMNSNELHYANMFIMKKELFNEYCLFLFSVLEIHKNETLAKKWISNLNDGAYSRILGYIGELLTDLFIRKCNKSGSNICELPVLFYDK